MVSSTRPHSFHQTGPWITADGNSVFYRRDWYDASHNTNARTSTPSSSLDAFPTPLIGPRRIRPQSIHILSYPPGYTPSDLVPGSNKSLNLGIRRKKKQQNQESPCQEPPSPSRTNAPFLDPPSPPSPIRPACHRSSSSDRQSKPPFFNLNLPLPVASAASSPRQPTLAFPRQGQDDSATSSDLSSWPLSDSAPSTTPTRTPTPQTHSPAMPSRRSVDAAFAYRLPADVGFLPSRAHKSPFASVAELPKPVASGSGVTCSILLAEQNVFLYGFDHDDRSRQDHRSGTALLRGRLRLNVTKNVKIKAVQLKLLGRARTEWPEGLPPLKQDFFEEESLRTQVLTFFNAINDGWGNEYGNQCSYSLKSSSNNSSQANLGSPAGLSQSHRTNLTPKEFKRLSLQSVPSRSLGMSDYSLASATQTKGYKVFYPGTYDYSFELPIDYHQLETTKLQYGSVKWELQAIVDRAGAFKSNLRGVKQVPIIRLPDPMSQEMSEPISISRQWENQLHYEIVISGKSFAIGSRIPIALKLTPLDKVQVHKIKVLLTETTEYWTGDRRVTRKDSGRKMLLLEKVAGKPLDGRWRHSSVTTLRGGELTGRERQEARQRAAARRAMDAARRQTTPEPLPEPTDNLLGELDLGLESMWGPTEMEALVQMPTCEMMARNKDLRIHPDCSWKSVNVYHWIKVVMRISRADPSGDATGSKRRHFEISIDSPFTVLDCRATKANTYLPSYTGVGAADAQPEDVYQTSCGCPDAHVVAAGTTTPSPPAVEEAPDWVVADDLPTTPRAAHLYQQASPEMMSTPSIGVGGFGRQFSGSAPASPSFRASSQRPRPIHLLRAPSFNPPSFDADTAPPPMMSGGGGGEDSMDMPLMTPPPNYDTVVGTPSVDGLADYFARLANYSGGGGGGGLEGDEGDEEESDGDGDVVETRPRIMERSGRVNVLHPRTSGRRMPSRSLELSRPALALDGIVGGGGGGGGGLFWKHGRNRTDRGSMAS